MRCLPSVGCEGRKTCSQGTGVQITRAMGEEFRAFASEMAIRLGAELEFVQAHEMDVQVGLCVPDDADPRVRECLELLDDDHYAIALGLKAATEGSAVVFLSNDTDLVFQVLCRCTVEELARRVFVFRSSKYCPRSETFSGELFTTRMFRLVVSGVCFARVL